MEILLKHRFEEKLLFVPSYSVGHQIGETLAKTVGSWINLRMTTVGGYAQGLAAAELGNGGIRLIDRSENFLIVESILRADDKLGGPGCYFEGAHDIPGVIRSLGNTIHELRMAGIGPGDVDPGSFLVAQKGEAVQRLLDAYEAFLAKHRFTDPAGLISLAVGKLRVEGSPKGSRVVMVLSDFPLAELEKRLIAMVGGNRLEVIRHPKPAALETPGRFFPVSDNEEGKSLEAGEAARLFRGLFGSGETPASIEDGCVSLFHALGESNEVREVFRRVLAQGVRFDEVEVLVTAADPYISLIYEIASALDIPVTFSGGIPITYTRPGRALFLYLKWQAEDFPAGHVMRLFSWGYLDLERVEPQGERPSAGKAAAMVRDAGIGWGRARYEMRLRAFEKRCLARAAERRENGEEEKAERAEREAGEAAWTARFMKGLLAPIPHETPEETAALESVCRGAVDFLEKFCRIAGGVDARARERLVEILETLARAPSAPEPAKEVLERIMGIVRAASIGHSTPRPGHVHVAHYRSGGYSGRTSTFVLGLDQAKFPGPLLQDPVILDGEREKLSPRLALARDLLEENRYILSKVLCSLTGRVCLSCSCRDLRDDRDLFPSSVMLSAYRLVSGNSGGDYSDLKEFLGPPAGFIPSGEGAPLNETEWWLSERGADYGSDSVLAAYGNLLAGERAERERARETLTEYEGWLPSSRGALDPARPDAVLSCSRLEDLAACPFGFFIRHVLGIEPLEEVEKDPGRWLDALQRGELLHDVFFRFMEELKAGGELPAIGEHRGRLEAIAMEEVERWKEEVPLSSELAFNREVEDIRRTLEIFLRNEEERCKTVRPESFELSFGLRRDTRYGDAEEEPVEIPLKSGGSFRLRGRIDRVDQSGAHEYEVWDYKTGSAYKYTEEGYTNHGRNLQHALYSLAAEILLRRRDEKARVVRAGYFFPSPRGEGLRIVKQQVERGELYQVVGELFALLKTGVLPATVDKGDCRFCDYEKICGDPEAVAARSRAKMENDAKMDPLKRLKDHA